ncbi:MAG: hypothetical protein ACO1SX_13375 [Actinomycetota bacterium]
MSTDELAAQPEGPGWRRYQAGVLALFAILAYVYVFTVQPGFGPDEPRHLNLVRFLLDERRLPVLSGGHEEGGAHTLHPPLYYLLVSPVYAVARGAGERTANMAVKCVSPLLIFGALLLFLATLRRVFPGRPFAVSAALTVTALLPEVFLEAAVMNNDSLAVLLGSLLLWHLVRTWDDPPNLRDAVIAGLILAAFVNTKAQGWTLAPLWALAVAQKGFRDRSRLGACVRDVAVGYALPLLLGTWWYVRNYQLYHQPVPLDFMGGAVQPHHSRTGELLTPIQVYTSGEVVTLGWRSAVGLFQSFWTQIDWISEPLRPAVFGTLLVLFVLAVLGFALQGWRWWSAFKSGKAERPRRLPPLALLGSGFALNWLHTWFVATFLHLGFYQGGRYLMPSVFGAGALLAAGWEALLPRKAHPAALGLVCALLLGMNALCLVELITYLNPKYVH